MAWVCLQLELVLEILVPSRELMTLDLPVTPESVPETRLLAGWLQGNG